MEEKRFNNIRTRY